ncbi:MAG: acetate--CoA ligase family protein [Deltaproteobacteria bacterium]|nr:acetate--CoA ligase family protein [Deltaproteobacteria bacterium]
MKIIETALEQGRHMLSEYESKKVLASYQIPVTKEIEVDSVEGLVKATQDIGYPVVLKGCASEIAHKTEKDLIQVDIRNDDEARIAFEKIKAGMNGIEATVLVQEMVKGQRELVIGLTRDAQFGPCVMFGLGGIFTEILKDISFRVAPLEKRDALEMMQEIKGHKILGAVRGMEAADLDQLCEILIRVGQIGLDHEEIKEVDINPVILAKGKPVAVDALIVLERNR